MNWINGYLKTTLFFFKDEKVTFEQLAILPAVFSGFFYYLFINAAGRSHPAVSLKPYIFPVILVFVISYYAAGKKGLLSQWFLKLIRLLVLHSIMTLLFFTSILSVDMKTSNLFILYISSALTSVLLAVHTIRIYPAEGSNPFKTKGIYYFVIAGLMVSISLLTGFFLYNCALPHQW